MARSRMSSARVLGIAPMLSIILVHGLISRAISTILSGHPWGIEEGLV